MTTIKTNSELWQEVYDIHAERVNGGGAAYKLAFGYYYNGKYMGWKKVSVAFSHKIYGYALNMMTKVFGVKFSGWYKGSF